MISDGYKSWLQGLALERVPCNTTSLLSAEWIYLINDEDKTQKILNLIEHSLRNDGSESFTL